MDAAAVRGDGTWVELAIAHTHTFCTHRGRREGGGRVERGRREGGGTDQGSGGEPGGGETEACLRTDKFILTCVQPRLPLPPPHPRSAAPVTAVNRTCHCPHLTRHSTRHSTRRSK